MAQSLVTFGVLIMFQVCFSSLMQLCLSKLIFGLSCELKVPPIALQRWTEPLWTLTLLNFSDADAFLLVLIEHHCNYVTQQIDNI